MNVSNARQPDTATDALEQVKSVVLSATQAFEAGDIQAMNELFRPDVVVFEGDIENYGWEDFRDNHIEPELANLIDITYDYENIHVEVDGSMVLVFEGGASRIYT